MCKAVGSHRVEQCIEFIECVIEFLKAIVFVWCLSLFVAIVALLVEQNRELEVDDGEPP